MNMIHEQEDAFQQTMNKEDQSDQGILFKYFIKCDSCSWSTSFYEASGNIHLNTVRLRCSICFKKEVRWWKGPF